MEKISKEEKEIRELNRQLKKVKYPSKRYNEIIKKIIKLRKKLGEHKHSWVYDKNYETSCCSICGKWDID